MIPRYELPRTLAACPALLTSSISFGAAVLAADASPGAADIIADQIRRQGYHCEKALSAERDERQSRPNAAVWHLTCSDGAYRVVLVPDLAAHVERIER